MNQRLALRRDLFTAPRDFNQREHDVATIERRDRQHVDQEQVQADKPSPTPETRDSEVLNDLAGSTGNCDRAADTAGRRGVQAQQTTQRLRKTTDETAENFPGRLEAGRDRGW